MAKETTMNQAQLQILDMLSFIKTPEALRDLNKVISDYLFRWLMLNWIECGMKVL